MPRLTRAALRSNPDSLDSIQNTAGERRVFGEITGNSSQAPEPPASVEIPIEEEKMAPKKTTTKGKGKKGKAAKKPKEDTEEVPAAQVPAPEVLEDDNQSTSSEAADEAAEKLRSQHSHAETYQIPMADLDRPNTPPSDAAKEARRQLSPKTPKFDPKVHTSNSGEELEDRVAGGKEDSFVEKIESRSPAKRILAAPDEAPQELEVKESLMERTASRSPLQAISRIEDSVDAIDALEDALEEIGQALPSVDSDESAVKTRKEKPSSAAMSRKESQDRHTVKNPAHLNTKSSRQTSTVTSRNSSAIRRVPSTAKPTMKPTATKPETSRSRPHAQPQMTEEAPAFNRSTSRSKPPPPKALTKAPFQPAKSTKPPTTSAFELPGEAISRRLKAQREERLKKEEEEAQKRKEFKAKPVKMSTGPAITVKPTAASKARANLKDPSSQEGGDKEGTGKSRPSSIGGEQISKRLSQLAMPKRNQQQSITSPISPANPSPVRSSSILNPKRVSSSVVPAAGTGAKTVVTKEEALQQKQRAKEIFGRDRAVKEDREREKREKEEAAKKARAEAAERGRQASREWAEKQKAKQAAMQAEKTKEAI